MINSFYICYLPYFDNSMINQKFLQDQPIHIFHKCNILELNVKLL